jgi:hypothetical protein
MPDAKTAALNTKRRFASYAVSLHCFQIFAVMQKDEHSNEYSSGFCPIYSTAVTVIIVVHELNLSIMTPGKFLGVGAVERKNCKFAHGSVFRRKGVVCQASNNCLQR